MPKRTTEALDLFDRGDTAPDPALEALARNIPAGIRFGTSSWTYDGWARDVYHRPYHGAEPARRLEEYARYPLFGTVGIDSAFYEPPSEETLRRYAAALPPGFPCVSKVWDRITARRFTRDRRWGALAGKLNPDFLNAALFIDAVLAPYARAFGDHAGCFVFEFQPMRGTDRPAAAQWAEELDAFLSKLPTEFRYAVELRNPELLTPLHGAVLKQRGVAHLFNSWTEMPSIGEQLELPWVWSAPFTVARALLRPGRSYQHAVTQFQPYDRVQEAQPEVRRDLLRLIRGAMSRAAPGLIVVNNRLEGNAPGTIRALAQMIAADP